MKYKLTSEQLKKLVPKSLKKAVFRFWDNQKGIDNIRSTMSFFSIPAQFYKETFKWSIEWYGEDKINQKIEEISNKIMKGVDGSYDFNFYLKNGGIDVNEQEIYFDVVAEGSGKVQVIWKDKILYDNIYDASNSDEVGWEVKDEIKDIVYDEIRYKLGLPFDISIYRLDITPKDEILEV